MIINKKLVKRISCFETTEFRFSDFISKRFGEENETIYITHEECVYLYIEYLCKFFDLKKGIYLGSGFFVNYILNEHDYLIYFTLLSHDFNDLSKMKEIYEEFKRNIENVLLYFYKHREMKMNENLESRFSYELGCSNYSEYGEYLLNFSKNNEEKGKIVYSWSCVEKK